MPAVLSIAVLTLLLRENFEVISAVTDVFTSGEHSRVGAALTETSRRVLKNVGEKSKTSTIEITGRRKDKEQRYGGKVKLVTKIQK